MCISITLYKHILIVKRNFAPTSGGGSEVCQMEKSVGVFSRYIALTIPPGMFPAASTAGLGERKSVAQTPVVPSFPTEGKLGQPQLVW